jgi:hypothetical protein
MAFLRQKNKPTKRLAVWLLQNAGISERENILFVMPADALALAMFWWTRS